MIDLQTETTLRLNDARNLPWLKGRTGKRISKDSLQRWALRGLRGVRLETVRIGGTIFTSAEAILRFLERLNAGSDQAGNTPAATNSSATIARAERRLDDPGIV